MRCTCQTGHPPSVTCCQGGCRPEPEWPDWDELSIRKAERADDAQNKIKYEEHAAYYANLGGLYRGLSTSLMNLSVQYHKAEYMYVKCLQCKCPHYAPPWRRPHFSQAVKMRHYRWLRQRYTVVAASLKSLAGEFARSKHLGLGAKGQTIRYEGLAKKYLVKAATALRTYQDWGSIRNKCTFQLIVSPFPANYFQIQEDNTDIDTDSDDEQDEQQHAQGQQQQQG